MKVSLTTYFKNDDKGIVEISVKDTGIGILQEDLERIFEPFYRGKNVGMENGMGLGLSLVKEAVDLHGGTILVERARERERVLNLATCEKFEGTGHEGG